MSAANDAPAAGGGAPPSAPIEVKANAAPIVTRETFTIFVTAAFAFAADRLMHSDIAIAAVIPCGAIGATLGWRLWQSLASWRAFRRVAEQAPDSVAVVTHTPAWRFWR